MFLPGPKLASNWPPYLRNNFALALAAGIILMTHPATTATRRRLNLSEGVEAALTKALGALESSTVKMPPSMRGRFEILQLPTIQGSNRTVIFDVCHNIAGAQAFIKGLRSRGFVAENKRLPALVSILADKDCDEILDELSTALTPIYLFPANSARSWSPLRLAKRHRELLFFPNFTAAWTALETNLPIVVCGSVHAVGEVMAELGIGID